MRELVRNELYPLFEDVRRYLLMVDGQIREVEYVEHRVIIASLSDGRINSIPFPLEIVFLISAIEVVFPLVVTSCIVFSSVQKILQK